VEISLQMMKPIDHTRLDADVSSNSAPHDVIEMIAHGPSFFSRWSLRTRFDCVESLRQGPGPIANSASARKYSARAARAAVLASKVLSFDTLRHGVGTRAFRALFRKPGRLPIFAASQKTTVRTCGDDDFIPRKRRHRRGRGSEGRVWKPNLSKWTALLDILAAGNSEKWTPSPGFGYPLGPRVVRRRSAARAYETTSRRGVAMSRPGRMIAYER